MCPILGHRAKTPRGSQKIKPNALCPPDRPDHGPNAYPMDRQKTTYRLENMHNQQQVKALDGAWPHSFPFFFGLRAASAQRIYGISPWSLDIRDILLARILIICTQWFNPPRSRRDINNSVPNSAEIIREFIVPSTATRPRQTVPHSVSPVPRTTATHSSTYGSGVLELRPGTDELLRHDTRGRSLPSHRLHNDNLVDEPF